MALKELQAQFPAPSTEIVPEDVWGELYFHATTHLKSEYSEAIFNIRKAGHVLSPADEKYLRFILTHRCGWSATYSTHMGDSWVLYLQVEYSHIKGLVPILDSLFLPEELESLPKVGIHHKQHFFCWQPLTHILSIILMTERCIVLESL